MTELDGVGWSALRNISPSFDRLELELLDEAQRAHVLHLSLPSDYPASPPRAEVALPAPFELQWAAEQQRFSVRAAAPHARLRGAPAGYRAPLFATAGATPRVERSARLGSAAAHCPGLLGLTLRAPGCAAHSGRAARPLRVQEQVVRPSRSRRFCGVQALRLHVAAPASLPTLQFLGAEKSLAGYRSALNARLAQWRPERSVRLNLEAVLDVKFPSPQEARTLLTYNDYTSKLPSLQDALDRPRVPWCHRPPAISAGVQRRCRGVLGGVRRVLHVRPRRLRARDRMRRLLEALPQIVPVRVAERAALDAPVVQPALWRVSVLQPARHSRGELTHARGSRALYRKLRCGQLNLTEKRNKIVTLDSVS
eukprot:scaffold16245_cov67-Phaeocystis_antarctica.AAC.4